MAALIQWGKNDCLIDLHSQAHERLTYLRDTHDETLEYVAKLSERERWHLCRDTAKRLGYGRVYGEPEIGDGAIADFFLATGHDSRILKPWFATMHDDRHWYARMPRGLRVVDYSGHIEIYRKCQP